MANTGHSAAAPGATRPRGGHPVGAGGGMSGHLRAGQRGSGTLGSRELSPSKKHSSTSLPATQGHPRWPPQLAQGSWAPGGRGAYLRDWGQGLGVGSKGGAETPLLSGAGAGERLGGSRPRAQAHEDLAPTCPGSERLPSPAHGSRGMWTYMHTHSHTSPRRHAHAAARPTTRVCTDSGPHYGPTAAPNAQATASLCTRVPLPRDRACP